MLRLQRGVFNHYKILNVSFRANQGEIKEAFRALAKRYHPDQNPNNPESEKKFREVKEAYECLSNKLKRSEYDRDWLLSGKPMWNPSAKPTDDTQVAEDDARTLTRVQLAVVYAAVIGLPFAASLGRRSTSDEDTRPDREGDAWSDVPPLPESSPRDELVRAFYNPMTCRWERLDDSLDPPIPVELFQFTVREKPSLYKQMILSVRSAIQNHFLRSVEKGTNTKRDGFLQSRESTPSHNNITLYGSRLINRIRDNFTIS